MDVVDYYLGNVILSGSALMSSCSVLLLRLLEAGNNLLNNINIYHNESHSYIFSVKSRNGRMLNLGEIKMTAPF